MQKQSLIYRIKSINKLNFLEAVMSAFSNSNEPISWLGVILKSLPQKENLIRPIKSPSAARNGEKSCMWRVNHTLASPPLLNVPDFPEPDSGGHQGY